MKSVISHKNGRIDTIQVNNVMSSDMADAIINTNQNIRQLNASAVFGADLVSQKSKEKIGKLSQ